MIYLWRMEKKHFDAKKALHLLISLTSSYQILSKILLHLNMNSITYNEVVSGLFVDEVKQEMMSSSCSLSKRHWLWVEFGHVQVVPMIGWMLFPSERHLDLRVCILRGWEFSLGVNFLKGRRRLIRDVTRLATSREHVMWMSKMQFPLQWQIL